jgi:hypothetical protein
MSNELFPAAPSGGAISNPDELSSLLDSMSATPESAGGLQYMSYSSREGEYTMGRDKSLCNGAEAVFDWRTAMHGWHEWVPGQNIPEKVMVPRTETLPAKPAARGENGPSQAVSMGGVVLNDGEDSTPFEISGSTMGMCNAIGRMINAVKMHKASGETEYLFPVVRLETAEPYVSKYGSTVINPQLTLVGWANLVTGDIKYLEDAPAAIEDKSADADSGAGKKRRAARRA